MIRFGRPGGGGSGEGLTPAQEAKLNGIQAGATANSTDAHLLNREHHTGTQTIETVAGLQEALNQLDSAIQQAAGGDLAGIEGDIEDLQIAVDNLQTQINNLDLSGDFDPSGLEQDIQQLQQQFGELDIPEAFDPSGLEQDIQQLQTQINNLDLSGDFDPSSLEQDIQQLQQQFSELDIPEAFDPSGLEQQISGKIPATEKGAAGGVATLDEEGELPESQMPLKTINGESIRGDGNLVIEGGDGGSDSGWTPVIAVVEDGNRRVLQVVDYDGGTGDKPATGLYVGPTGLVSDIAEAVEIGEVVNNNTINNYIVDTDLTTSPYHVKVIGETFNLATHLTGIVEPSNNLSDAKFVKLTAGLDGAGQFNEGLLINETITGSGPTIEITAEIATGPLAGNIIHLINSENRYLMPGENSGAVADDQMQQITAGASQFFSASSGLTNVGGAFSWSTTATNTGGGGNVQRRVRLTFNSANSPDARTGDHTNVKHIQATYYMRIA